jgi:hypothetical protein
VDIEPLIRQRVPVPTATNLQTLHCVCREAASVLATPRDSLIARLGVSPATDAMMAKVASAH